MLCHLVSVEVEACCLSGGNGGVEVEAFLINTCRSSLLSLGATSSMPAMPSSPYSPYWL